MNNIETGLLILLLLLLFLMRFMHQRKGKRIHHWMKSLHLDQHQKIFDDLYQDVDGFSLSKDARKENDAMEYTYGEIKFIPFIALLSLIKLDKETVFYDLGSGTGKAVLACAMTFHLKKCCGIELFPNLHQAACQQLEKLNHLPGYQPKTPDIHFFLGNFLTFDLSEANLIFINASALIGESWIRLNHVCDELTTCNMIITTSKPLISPSYQCIQTTFVEMSWGPVQAFIHQRSSSFPPEI